MKKPKEYKIENSSPSILEDTMVYYQVMYANPVSLLSNSKKGLSAKAALDFISISGFTYDEFQETFKTTVKTIQNYAAQKLKLDASLSEKLLKCFALFKKGIEVFGSAKAFHQWLNTSAYGLGNQIPYTLMDTFTGISLIEEELIRIEYGALA
jgi:putative toxin-antitoxin system antitoxin component (TIGR02293 family)